MNGATEAAHVYRGTELAGRISRTRKGSVFEYDPKFLAERARSEESGIAIHLPYSAKRFETAGVNLHTFFAGLLPEGLRLKALVKRVKTSEDDLLSLLVAAGADCVGDVSVVASGESPMRPAAVADPTKLDQVVFADLFRESIAEKPTGQPERFSIPGVQEKISASMISFPVTTRKSAKSYILKLNPADQPLLVENEHFFLRMAGDCGLCVNPAKLVKDRAGASGLLVERFDRHFDPAKKAVFKLHQEDACQFLDRYPADKYRVKFSEIAEGLSVCTAPILEVAKLIRLKAFSYLIGNGDLHAKNVSLFAPYGTGRLELSPAYDLLSTLPYGDQKMALQFEGRDDNLKRQHFVAFGKRFEVKPAVVSAILDEICDTSSSWIERTAEIGLPDKKTRFLEATMKKRRDDLG